MQVTQTNAEGLKREFKVVIPAETIDEKLNERLESLKASVNLPGFRPGKVPTSLLKKRYGQSVMGEILEQTVNESSQQALEKHEVRPATQPKIEIVSFDEGQDLEYTLEVETMPEIEKQDFSTLALTRLTAEVPDEEVDKALEQIAEQHKHFHDAPEDRAAEEGDAVVIDFTGYVDGEAFEGGKAEGYELVLGSGSFIPGFEDQLVGAKAGEDRSVKVSFPENYQAEHLAGKEATFECKVQKVRVAEQHGVNDELAKHIGFDDVEALKKAVREDLENRYRSVSRQRVKRDLLDQLADRYEFEVPPSLLESEFESIWNQFQQEVERSGKKLDELEQSEEELRKEYHDIALRRVRLGLVLAEIGADNKIEVSNEELNQALLAQARQYPGQEQQVVEYFQKNPEAIQQLRAPIFEEKVVDYLIELAKVEDKQVSPDELLRDPDEEAEEAAEKKPAKKATAKKAPAKKTAAKKTTAKKTTTKKAEGDEAAEKKPAAKKAPAKKTAAKKTTASKATTVKKTTAQKAEDKADEGDK